MMIGERLKQLRENKKFSQGDIENQTGLLRCYVSRVENGHTVPAVETLEKFARALQVPMYQLFYDGEEPPKNLTKLESPRQPGFGAKGKESKELFQFQRLLGKMSQDDRKLLVFLAQKMARG